MQSTAQTATEYSPMKNKCMFLRKGTVVFAQGSSTPLTLEEDASFSITPGAQPVVEPANQIINIVINGRGWVIGRGTRISYEHLTYLTGNFVINKPTVTFYGGKDNRNLGGSLLEGQSIECIEGMIFNVYTTNQA